MTQPLIVRRGELTIDLARQRVVLGSEPIALAYREYALLVYLATKAGHVVAKRRLLEEGLGRHDFGGLRMVDELIRQLKLKLERNGQALIEETGDGYKFI